jgi:hypothetical protein
LCVVMLLFCWAPLRNELCVWVDGFHVRFSSVRIVRFVRFGSFVSVRSFRSFRFVQVLFVCLFWSQECVLARALLLRYFRLDPFQGRVLCAFAALLRASRAARLPLWLSLLRGEGTCVLRARGRSGCCREGKSACYAREAGLLGLVRRCCARGDGTPPRIGAPARVLRCCARGDGTPPRIGASARAFGRSRVACLPDVACGAAPAPDIAARAPAATEASWFWQQTRRPREQWRRHAETEEANVAVEQRRLRRVAAVVAAAVTGNAQATARATGAEAAAQVAYKRRQGRGGAVG